MMTMMSFMLSFPSQLQGRDEEAEDDQVERPEVEEDDCVEDEFAEPDVVEVADDVLNVMDVVLKRICRRRC